MSSDLWGSWSGLRGKLVEVGGMPVVFVALDERHEEMEKPAFELLPSAPLFPYFGRELEAACVAVGEKDVLQFGCGAGVCHQDVALIVEREAAAVEVGRADEGIAVVDHHDFAVVEPAFEEVNLHAAFHELVYVVLHDARGDGDVTLG